MATTIEEKIRSAALLNAPLVSLLGSSPFRWFGPQPEQGAQMPRVRMQRISAPSMYTVNQRMTTRRYRMQFVVEDTDKLRGESVLAAMRTFFDTFNAMNTSQTVGPNQVVDDFVGESEAQPDPITYWLRMDVYIWNNELT